MIEAFLDALNEIVGNSDDYLTRLKENLETAINEVHPESAAALAAKMAKLQQELIDRTERRENYDDITEEILRLRELQAQTAMDDNAKSDGVCTSGHIRLNVFMLNGRLYNSPL